MSDTPLSTLLAGYGERLAGKAAEGSLRRCRISDVLPDSDGVQVLLDGEPAVNFSSNDYLGLAQDPRLKAAAMVAIQQEGTGSSASRLISGTSPRVVALETALARWKHAEAALVFNSGYQANVAILQAILSPGDWVFCDKLNHASLMDGCLWSGANWSRYRHLDLAHLVEKLAKAPPSAQKWIVTDSVFSMDGDYPDLKRLVEIAERHQALIMVDEAHASGLYGATSGGLCEHFGVSQQIALQMGTFSKALGSSGAYVAGPKVLIDWLVNMARGFIYSTAQPPGVIGASLAAVQLVQQDATMRTALWENVGIMARAIQANGLEERIPLPLRSPIVPVLIGDSADTLRVSQQLLDAGYYVQGIRPPTVPPKTGRLRIALSAAHTEDQINGLVRALQQRLKGV